MSISTRTRALPVLAVSALLALAPAGAQAASHAMKHHAMKHHAMKHHTKHAMKHHAMKESK
ncbi:MAG TPA: hypothetical protein VGF95_11835 [Solirubrobacteraceae bacterium]|jgi:pentapeptide MXKDX repeat protein